jgi:tetratricopeptide (TPR) repeat protein
MRCSLALAALLGALLAAPAARGGVPGARSSVPVISEPRILQLESLARVGKEERAALFEEYVLAVRAARASGNQARGRELAERATMLFPALRRPWLHLAATRLALEQFGPAIEAARRAETAQDDDYAPPSSPDETAAGAAYWEGVSLYRTQRYDEALPRLRAATSRAPHWAEAARALGEAEFVSGHAAAALAAYTTAFDLDPRAGSAQDLAYFAEARADAGDLEGGIAALQEALLRSPYTAGLHAKLGDLLRRQGQLAAAYYELVMEALVQGVEGPFSSPAVNLADRIVKQAGADTTNAARHELLVVSSGLASLEAGDAHRTIHQMVHVLSISRTNSPVPHLVLADAYLRFGKPDKAREQLQELLRLQPDFVPALYGLSEVETKLGLPKDASRDLERAQALFPGYWKFHETAAKR